MAETQTVSSAEGGYVRVLAGEVGRLMVGSSQSATLDDVTHAGCWHVVIDEKAREVVFDMRALYLGFLVAGAQPRKGNASNTAQWFFEWLNARIGRDVVAKALEEALAQSRIAQVERLLSDGFRLTLSISVKGLLNPAAALAKATVKRAKYDARHLFAAMIEAGGIGSVTQEVFGLTLTAGDINDLQRTMIDHIMRSPQRGETRGNWQGALRLGSGTGLGSGPPPPPPPDRSIAPFNGDTPSAAGEDVLDTAQDVEALAQLVCLEGATPLAVAIFGDWGSGKSTFMARLEARVKALAVEGEPIDANAPGVARFVQPIVQIRFNAWHFADANLWASLTAEFFDQLRAGGYDPKGQVRQAKLVQQVNQHVHALSETLSTNRKAMAKNGQTVLDAQKARDEAAKDVRAASGKVFAKTMVNLLSEGYAANERHLAALGLGDPADETKAAGVIVGVAKDAAATFGSLRAIWRVLSAARKRWWLALPVIAALIGWGAVAFLKPGLAWIDVVAPILAGGIGLLASFGQALGPALAIVRDLAKRGAALAGEIDADKTKAIAALVIKEAELSKALAETVALEEAEVASSRALARYVDPEGKANPPRLLRYVLEDDPDTKALEKDIGLIGRTRRLFQAVDDIARNVRDGREAVREQRRKTPDVQVADYPDTETPERIVIYIDDLDRCSETKVYEVLQAIHLLLAFDLFVVVVGVDVNWVQAALARQFETGEREADRVDEQKRRERAVNYLEKIFQVPFWLRPLGREADGTFDRFVRSLAGAPAEAAASLTKAGQSKSEQAKTGKAAKASTTVAARAAGQGAGPSVQATEGGAAAGSATSATAPPPAEVRRTLQLDKAEIDFLASPEIAAVAAVAPRGVKRLVNIYRLARTRRGQEDGQAILGGPNRPPEYPLIALMAAVETGQGHAVAEAFYDVLKDGKGGVVTDLIGQKIGLLRDDTLVRGLGTLRDASLAAAKMRNGVLLADDLLAAARLVRRYSFNRYR